MIPLGDASRRPLRFPIITTLLIGTNALVFMLELAGGSAFIDRWSLVPADIMAGRNWITILSAMFMHAGWALSSLPTRVTAFAPFCSSVGSRV